MNLNLEVTKQPEDISDAKNGDRLLTTVAIYGALHHLEFMRVVDDENGDQCPANPEYEEMYSQVQALYAGRYETFKIPGFEGDYIAFMHPFDD
jgi:hypothetical protein